jgi:hypothetical protein
VPNDIDPERPVAILMIALRHVVPDTPRTEAEIGALFDGFELVEPGLVALPQWRPDTSGFAVDGDLVRGFCAGVGRRP